MQRETYLTKYLEWIADEIGPLANLSPSDLECILLGGTLPNSKNAVAAQTRFLNKNERIVPDIGVSSVRKQKKIRSQIDHVCLVVEPKARRLPKVQVVKKSSIQDRSQLDLLSEDTGFSQSEEKIEEIEPGYVSMAKFLNDVFPLRLLGLAKIQKEWKKSKSPPVV